MFEQLSRWVTSGLRRASRLSGAGVLAVVAAGAGSVGCGAYEPEPSFPDQHYVAPTPPSAAELAAQQQARQEAAAESREILVGADADEYSDTDPSALTEFKPVLEGHGTWVDDPSYGTVWVPAKEEVGADFQPYVTAGHWTYSEATDYVWVSDYSWGWAPFHYGRWVLLPNHGWAWIPGRRYAGAWVTWRVGPAGYGYVGWAPAPPSWYWHHGVAYGWSFGWYHHHHHYVYCPREYIHQPTLPSHVVRGPAAREHDGRTQDYVAASPGVSGGGRVVANPSVGGGDRIVASPGVSGGRVTAKPGVGPRPDEIGLKNEMIVAPPASDQGLARARALAAPQTAIAAGAAPPAHLRSRSFAAQPNIAPSPTTRGPASPAFVPEGSRGIAAAAPRPNGPVDTSPRARLDANPRMTPPPVDRAPMPSPYQTPPRYSASPNVSPPVSSFREPPRVTPSPRVTPPVSSFREPPRVTPSPRVTPPVSPSFRSSPPAVRSTPSFRSSAPAVRSTPSFGSSPSFRSSAPAVRSTPSFRSSAPAVRSAPSVRASPSVRSSPAVRASPGIRRR